MGFLTDLLDFDQDGRISSGEAALGMLIAKEVFRDEEESPCDEYEDEEEDCEEYEDDEENEEDF